MTIYEMPIPSDIEAQVKELINKGGYLPPTVRQSNIRTLTSIYLRYVEPHEWQPKEERFEPKLKAYLSCSKCVNKVMEYFETRYENE